MSVCVCCRIMELEGALRRREEEHQQYRHDIDAFQHNLKASLSVSEETINKERTEHATTKYDALVISGGLRWLFVIFL